MQITVTIQTNEPYWAARRERRRILEALGKVLHELPTVESFSEETIYDLPPDKENGE